MIHVMAATGLGGAAMAAPVVGYDAIAVLEEEQHMRVPVICRQRPAVAEHDRLTCTPVLVEDLNAVFGCDGSHARLLSKCGGSDRRLLAGGRLQIDHGVAEVAPGPVAAGQRAHALDAVTLEEQRHPGAGGLVGSGAVEHD